MKILILLAASLACACIGLADCKAPRKHTTGYSEIINHESCVDYHRRENVSVGRHASCYGGSNQGQHCYTGNKTLQTTKVYYSSKRCSGAPVDRRGEGRFIDVRIRKWIDCSKDDGTGSGAQE